MFENPTLHNLAQTIAAVVADGSGAVKKDVTKEIEVMIDAYAHHIPTPAYAKNAVSAPKPGEAVVLLTGSTGNVGAHILASLLAESKVKKVYTLNRPGKPGEDRLKEAFSDKGLDQALLANPKLVQLHGDVTQDGFGLDAAVIEEASPLPSFLSKYLLKTHKPLTAQSEPDAHPTQRLATGVQPRAAVVRETRRGRTAVRRLCVSHEAARAAAVHQLRLERHPVEPCEERERPRGERDRREPRRCHRVRREQVCG